VIQTLSGWRNVATKDSVVSVNGVDLLSAHRFTLGEGPFWDEASHELLFVDILSSTINRYDPVTGELSCLEVGVSVGTAIPRASGGIAALEANGLALIDKDLNYRLVQSIEADFPANRMNDAKCDPMGRLYAGTISNDSAHEAAALYRVSNEAFETVVSPVTISNGLGWSPDGDLMYFIDTPTRRVDVFDYDLRTGRMRNRRPFVAFEKGFGWPDGMCVDSAGGLWVAFFEGSAVRRFSASGELTDEIKMPARQVTSCALGGPEFTDLYVTSASFDLSDGHPDATEHSGKLFRVEVGIPGLPGVRYPN